MNEFRILYGAYMTGRGKMATPECDNVLFSDTKILFMSEELTKQGYALVRMDGAEDRVAHIVEAGIDLQSGHQAIAREIIRAMTEES